MSLSTEDDGVTPVVHNHPAIVPSTLRVNVSYDAGVVGSIDVEIYDGPDADATSTVNPTYIGDVVAAILRANTPIARLRADMGPNGGRFAAGGRITNHLGAGVSR